MKIVLMGTPEFAVESFKKLHVSHHQIAGIVTIPDKPKGRGQKLTFSAVKNFALKNELVPILQPTNLKDEDFILELSKLNADLFVVVAFRILPEIIFSMPKHGTINLHASLLPQYRGAAPINWAIINGEKQTGVTTFLLNKGVDTGNILLQKSISIKKNETAGEVHDNLAAMGAELLLETVDLMEKNKIEPIMQKEGLFKLAPKLNKEILQINWENDAEIVKNQIHGLSPYPGAYTVYKNKKIKIFKVEVVDKMDENKLPGQIISVDKSSLLINTKSGMLSILELQFPGKRVISINQALKGYTFDAGNVLG